MTTPRCPSASAGSVLAIAAAAIRIRLNVPIRLMSMTLRYAARSCGDPSRPTVRAAQPMPAQLTATRSGAPGRRPPSTAACTDCSSDTSVLTNTPPISSAIALPRVLVEVGDEHPAARRGQVTRGGLAQAAGATGDDRCGSVQFHGREHTGRRRRPNGVGLPGRKPSAGRVGTAV